jgi:diguanylate cyclase (GGDEF)-like protein/PAS domain S-box-containing protein
LRGDPAGSEPVTGMSPDDETAMFRSISVASPNAILAADAQGLMVWANAAAETMFGWPVCDLVGKPLTLITTEDQHGAAHAARRRVLSGEPLEPVVTEGRRRDGETFTMQIATAVRRAPDGRVLGISLIATDLSDVVRVQRELTEALARSRARFDQTGNPQALLDLDGVFVAVNDAVCTLLRTPRERLVGQRAVDLMQPVDPVEATERLRMLREGEETSISTEVVVRCGDGGEVPVLVDLTVVTDDQGRPHEVALFAHDLSDVREAERRLESQDAFFRALNRRATDVVIVTDTAGLIKYVSPSVTGILGYHPEDVLGERGSDFLRLEDQEASASHQQFMRSTRHGETSRRLARVRTASGEWRWLDGLTTNCLDDPDIVGMVTNLRDVTAEIEAQSALQASESRFRAIAQTAQEGILALAPDGTVLFANDKLADIFGVTSEELYSRGIQAMLDSQESARLTDRLAYRHETGPEQYEVSYQHPDGTSRTLIVAASPLTYDDGSPMGSLGMISDVTASREAEAELRHRALHDTLTGLPNRALLVDRLTMATARMKRDGGRGLAVLFLDLDHFKLVNDSRGHEAGDRLLVDVAGRLLDAVRDVDTVARLGGDEFAVVCLDAGREDADLVAARIQEELARPFLVEGDPVYISASIGIALAPPYAVSDLLRFADAAMYEAKTGGRSQVTTYDGTESLGSKRRLAVIGALREALEQGGLALGYQPIVDFEHGRLVGLEALLRWQHHRLGAVPPEEVVHAAEAAGLCFELDRTVIRLATDGLLRLRQDGVVGDDVYVSVNISPRSTQQRRLDTLVREILQQTGLPPSCLYLEVTEHSIMDNAEHAVTQLGQLTELGVGIAIDDFGTGYNSLVHLQRLPLRVLKIDRSFVHDLATRTDSVAIARSIVGLAAGIGLETVAEGVETTEQAEILRDLGCRVGQGFLWGRAVPVGEVAAAVARWT